MKTNYLNEEWTRLIVKNLDLTEKYEISNYGRIKSFKVEDTGRIMKTAVLKGYSVITLVLRNNKRTTNYIHKLVAEHFLSKDSILQSYVIHLDFNKLNNHVSNLMWVTQPTMFAHQKINPHYHRGFVSNSKLSETEVIRLKIMLKKGKNKSRMLAKEFGITHTQLNRIRKGENWGHIIV